MKHLHYLNQPDPLAHQVADFLVADAKALPIDLSETLILTPTAGAGRRIRRALAKHNVLAPQFSQPMRALLPTASANSLANANEQEAAWAQVLQRTNTQRLYPLFGNNTPENEAELLKAGGVFCDLCNLLAEAALTPLTIELPESEYEYDDSSRWEVLKHLYLSYLETLKSWDRIDPNAARLKEIETPTAPFKRLVIACVPDLPRAFERYAESLITLGKTVNILIWKPKGAKETTNDWGRPDPSIWAQETIDVQPDAITLTKESADEAKLAIDFALNTTQKGDYGIILSEPKLGNALKTEIWSRGGTVFLPEGERLINSQAAVLILEWEAFKKTNDLRVLRRLLELPAFIAWIYPGGESTQAEALATCDGLLSKCVVATLQQGRELCKTPLPDSAHDSYKILRAKGRKLLGAIQAKLSASGLELIETLSKSGKLQASATTERVCELAKSLNESPAFKEWSGGFIPALSRTLRHESISIPPSSDAVELNGWLEAPWLEASRLALCGLIEGQLPKTIDGHPFLPDSMREALGLTNNAARFARDAYILDCLLRTRAHGEIHCFCSKFDADGNPNRPSRLLLSTSSAELPERVLQMTGKPHATRTRPLRQNNWRWKLPVDAIPKVEKISPTQFKDYLACPFRFCLKHVLKLDTFTTSAREMNAAEFGNLIHLSLESFGNAVIPMGEEMLKLDANAIYELAHGAFEKIAAAYYGKNPTPAVRIQIENARTRIYAFASHQAELFAEGWQIIDAEKKVEANASDPITVGPLKLSGIIDRIDRNAETDAWRIMDYKTFNERSTPASTHFGSASKAWINDAICEIIIKGRHSQKAWVDLQLPLYRFILEHSLGPTYEIQEPTTAYFLLPSDPYTTGIEAFVELNKTDNDEAYESAMNCAQTVAEKVAAGIFWPPQPFNKPWEDPIEALMINGSAEACIDPESIEILKGGDSQ